MNPIPYMNETCKETLMSVFLALLSVFWALLSVFCATAAYPLKYKCCIHTRLTQKTLMSVLGCVCSRSVHAVGSFECVCSRLF